MSLRLRLIRGGLRMIVKPLFRITRHALPARIGLMIGSLALPMPFGVTAQRGAGRPDLVRFRPKSGVWTQGPTVLWFHGGAYVSGSAFTHRGMLGRIALASGCEVIAVRYPLAPEHPAPAAFDAGMAAVGVLDLPMERVVLGGDSAGGGLAAAICAQLCAQGTPPLGMVLLSPWTDMTLSGASIVTNAARDPLIPVKPMAEAARQICAALPPADPRISPLFAHWHSPCKALFQVGTTEVLLDDTLRLAETLRKAGGDVTTKLQPGAPHVLAFLAPWVPEAQIALTQIGDFIRGLCPPRLPSDN